MKKTIPAFFKDVHIRAALLVSSAIFAITVVLAYRAFHGIDHLLVIHFEAGHGIDLLGNGMNVFWFLAIGFFAYLLNIWIAHLFYGKEKIFSYVISYFTILLTLLILIATTVIISIN